MIKFSNRNRKSKSLLIKWLTQKSLNFQDHILKISVDEIDLNKKCKTQLNEIFRKNIFKSHYRNYDLIRLNEYDDGWDFSSDF